MADCRLAQHSPTLRPGPDPGAGSDCEVQGSVAVVGVTTVREFLALHCAKVGHMVDVSVFSSKLETGADFLPQQRLVTGLLHTIDPVSGLVFVVSAASGAGTGEDESGGTTSNRDAARHQEAAAAVEEAESNKLCDGGEAASTVHAKVLILNFRYVASVEARPDLRDFEIVTGHRGGTCDRRMARGGEGGSTSASESGAAGFDSSSAAATRARKDRLVEQLRALRVAFEEEENDGTLRILHGALRIHPPYTLADCVSKNETVLQRVAGMLEF